jgi:Nucleotidyl transferase AbiEii toxin, Type IV TA system
LEASHDGPEFAPGAILDALVRNGVDFVLIGGIAAIVRGSVRPSFDIDIAYGRDRENLERLVSALRQLGATLRGAPDDVPFLLDADTLARGSHFTFETDFGSLDILHDPEGAPPYAELVRGAGAPEYVEGHRIRVASIDHLIAMKEASARPHDKVVATELRVISDELRAPKDG